MNILLDVSLKRDGFEASARVLEWCQDRIHSGVISWHTLSVFHYINEKKKGAKVTRMALASLLDYIDVAPTDTSSAKMAVKSNMKDFEDAMQSMAALKSGCDFIITRNVKDFKYSPVPALVPEKLKG